MKSTETLIILSAGEGSRLSPHMRNAPKPEVELLGVSLGERVLVSHQKAGIKKVIIVLGHEAASVRNHWQRVANARQMEMEFVFAEEWKKGNGVSLSAAKKLINGDENFLITMTDHLVDPGLVERVIANPPKKGEISLAIDKNTRDIFDEPDATKVVTDGDKIVQINKVLDTFNGIDTGVFHATPAIFEALDDAQKNDGNSLSDGVRTFTEAGKFKVIDVTGFAWLDVDTPEAYQEAKRRVLSRLEKTDEDGFISQYINRPLSKKISLKLVETKFSPNQITFFSFLLGVFAAFFIAIGSLNLAGLFIILSSIIDGCDGEVARLKNLQTNRGGWFDSILDRYCDTLLVVAIAFKGSLSFGVNLAWVLSLVFLSGFLLAGYANKEFLIRFGRNYENKLLNGLKRRDLRLLVFALGCFIGKPFMAMALIGVVTHLCLLAMFLEMDTD